MSINGVPEELRESNMGVPAFTQLNEERSRTTPWRGVSVILASIDKCLRHSNASIVLEEL
jgi:hypothetical protein